MNFGLWNNMKIKSKIFSNLISKLYNSLFFSSFNSAKDVNSFIKEINSCSVFLEQNSSMFSLNKTFFGIKFSKRRKFWVIFINLKIAVIILLIMALINFSLKSNFLKISVTPSMHKLIISSFCSFVRVLFSSFNLFLSRIIFNSISKQ